MRAVLAVSAFVLACGALLTVLTARAIRSNSGVSVYLYGPAGLAFLALWLAFYFLLRASTK